MVRFDGDGGDDGDDDDDDDNNDDDYNNDTRKKMNSICLIAGTPPCMYTSFNICL